MGCSGFGGLYKPITKESCKSLVKKAIEAGINYFDTSPFYSKYVSETILGECLQDIPRNKFYVSTKCGRYAISKNLQKSTFDYSSKKIIESVHSSLKLLKLSYIDILFLHDIEFGDIEVIINESLPTLLQLKEKKLINYIGISGYPIDKINEVIERANNKIDVVLSYCNDSLQSNRLNQVIEKWKKLGIGVISASPYGMGLFTMDGPKEWHPASKTLKRIAKNANDYCKRKGINLSNIAIKHCYSNEHITTVLAGINSEYELKEAINCLNYKIPSQEYKELINMFKPVFNLEWC